MRNRVILLLLGALLTGCNSMSEPNNSDALVAEDARADPANWPSARSPDAITNPATEAKINDLLKRMSIEQKVGQLIQADIAEITPEDLAEYPLGSILAGGNSGPYGDERAGPAEWHRLVKEFREVSLRPAENGVAIPIIFGVDAVHGHNNLPGATVFPHNIGLGAANDPALIAKIAAATAAEVAGSGIEWTFAPTLAVPQDMRWGRTYEGYSADPAVVAAYGKAMVLGLQGGLETGETIAANHVAATAKHFLADGGTEHGKDQGDAKISEAELIARHAQGYPAAIDAGALTVMVSFSSWNGVKNHGNSTLLSGVLKQKMGFKGFVVGDWNGHGQVEGCSITSCARAINAGLDMFMAPDSWKGLFTATLAQARSGEISAERLDDAVRRILRVKLKLGLFEPDAGGRRDYAAIGAPEHLAIAREAVAKSLVLLKNNGSVLPIKPGAKVLVAGQGADNIAMQSGGWTVSWQGSDVTRGDFPNGQTIWEGLNAAIIEAGGAAQLSPAGSFAAKPDVAIVVFGEPPYAEMQGDVPTLDYQPVDAADLALIKRLKAQNIPVVSVFLSGRPMFTSPEINASDAFVAAWLPGSQGAGVADVLVASADGEPKRDFTGRLPFVWPADARSPVAAPVFQLGYGLSYANQRAVGKLSEALGLDITKAMNLTTFFSGGRARDPWELKIRDAGGDRPVGSAALVSPGGAIAVKSIDVNAQEDGKAFAWSGIASFSIDGPPADLKRQMADGQSLRLDWRVDARGSGKVGLSLGNALLDISPIVGRSKPGQVATVRIPLRCFQQAGANFSVIGNALRIEAGKGFGMTLLAAQIEAGGAPASCPPKAG